MSQLWLSPQLPFILRVLYSHGSLHLPLFSAKKGFSM